jgi:hypothetical protein
LSHCYKYEDADPSDLKYKDLNKFVEWQQKVAKRATEL